MTDPQPPKPRIQVGPYQRVFKGEMHEVHQAEAVYPDGHTRTFEILVRDPSVWGIPVTDDGQVVLTKEYRYSHNAYLWFLPAGRANPDEDPEAAFQRELAEELGWRADELRPLHVSEGRGWKRYAYVAKGLQEDYAAAGDAEDITPVPMSLDAALRLVVEGEITDEWIGFLIMKLYHRRADFGL